MRIPILIIILIALLVHATPLFAGPVEGTGLEATVSTSFWHDMKQVVQKEWNKVVKSVQGTFNYASERLPASLFGEESPRESSAVTKLKELAQEIQRTEIYSVQPGTASDVSLKKVSSGVSVFDLTEKVETQSKSGKVNVKYVKVKKIPYLNIGTESKLKSSKWNLESRLLDSVKKHDLTQLSTPGTAKDIVEFLKIKLQTLLEKKEFKTAESIEGIGIVTLKKVEDLQYSIRDDVHMTAKDVRSMDEKDLKMIRALILYSQGDKCHFASGLLYDLSKSQRQELVGESHYYLGSCYKKMGFYSAAIDELKLALDRGPRSENYMLSLKALLAFPDDYNIQIGQWLKPYLEAYRPSSANEDKVGLSEELISRGHYMVAASALHKESYHKSKVEAEKVSSTAKEYIRAQFVLGLSEYHLGQVKAGLERLRKLQSYLPKDNVHSDLHALISLNLARIAFQSHQYKESVQLYLAIDKSHPLWIQGLQEYAWVQLMSEDYGGAIGNMFSLQSTYLKSVYKPESFAIRSIGYLNLCQYADAYKTLSLMEREYRPWIPKIDGFQKKYKTNSDYYQAVISYLKSSSQSTVDGLPAQALREMARHKDFLNLQEEINRKIDEKEQIRFVSNFINRDIASTKQAKSLALAQIKKIQNILDLAKQEGRVLKDELQLRSNLKNEKWFAEYRDFELDVFEEAKHGYRSLQKATLSSLESDQSHLIVQAGGVLKHRLSLIEKDLKKHFENNEFLRYEVFAGSGENIRFQMAGGQAGRVPSSVKPTSKDLNWDFEGEFWEDEIGHYKSTIKNNCPKSAKSR